MAVIDRFVFHQQFWSKQRDTMLDLLQARNHSILAHGFTPLTGSEWTRMAQWVEAELLPLLLHHSQQQPWRIAHLPPQLPDVCPVAAP